MSDSGPIVFFDGVCGLCNSAVDFFMRHDRAERLRFAPLQGDTAAGLLAETDRTDLKSLVYYYEGGSLRKSAAVVRILWQLSGIWKVLGSVLWLIPLPLRDLGYMAVSATRYKVFGKKESCRLPTASERGRILT